MTYISFPTFDISSCSHLHTDSGNPGKFAIHLSVRLHTSYTRVKVCVLIILQQEGFFISSLFGKKLLCCPAVDASVSLGSGVNRLWPGSMLIFRILWAPFRYFQCYHSCLVDGYQGCRNFLALHKLRQFLLFQSGYFPPLTWLSRTQYGKAAFLSSLRN